MKKLMIGLFVLVAVCSSTFSATLKESHDIRLKTNVSGTAPAFQFEFTSGMSNAKGPVVTNMNADLFDESVDYNEYATRLTAIDVPDISRYSLDLVFTAKLANRAKCNGSYNLKLVADGFDVTRKQVPGKLNPKSIEIKAAEDLSARVGVSAGTVVAGQSINFDFTGALCSAGDLATFEVKYPVDDTIDPATYYTNITLEISSNS